MLRIAIVTLLFTGLLPLPIANAYPLEAKSPAAKTAARTASLADLSVWRLPQETYPEQNPYSIEKAELGRKLFFDPRLSGNSSRTCAACHHPGLGWADGMARALGDQQNLGRHTPSLINIGYAQSFFWDGRASTLEDAVSQDILSPGLSSNETARSIVVRIASIANYRKAFETSFGPEGVSFERITEALATFVRSIRSSSTPFDHWIEGDDTALSDSAKRGFYLFVGKAACVQCHTPPTFSDFSFHNTGINTVDPGHYEISGKDEHRNAFKTPGLRDVALTPPYMHNGAKASLVDTIDFYDRGGDAHGSGNELKPLHLSEAEKADLLAFLLSLGGEATETLMPALPVALMP